MEGLELLKNVTKNDSGLREDTCRDMSFKVNIQQLLFTLIEIIILIIKYVFLIKLYINKI